MVEGVQPFACSWGAELLTTSLVSGATTDGKVNGCSTGTWALSPSSQSLYTSLIRDTDDTRDTESVTGSNGDGPWWEVISPLLSPPKPPPTS